MSLQKNCLKCSSSFSVTDTDLAFYDKISPVINGEKFQIPPPTLCPDCRFLRRLAWRNERNLYPRTCGLCQKPVISMYHDHQIYCHKCWWGEDWDGTSYGMDPDLPNNFSEKFSTLWNTIPLDTLYLDGYNENSEYTNSAGYNKNCYLCFSAGYNEDCFYSRSVGQSKNTMDAMFAVKNEHCYELVNSHNCYRTYYAQNCQQCADSAFLYDCVGCQNCFGCTNLRHQQNYLFNHPSTEAEIKKSIKSLNNYSKYLEHYNKFKETVENAIHRANCNQNIENCSGEYLLSCKNCHDCYGDNNCEDCRFCDLTKYVKDGYDCYGHGYNSELIYESNGTGNSRLTAFTLLCDQVKETFYSYACYHSEHLFGCVGLLHKKYCIFNKQYTKEEYEKTLPQIIKKMQQTGEWGEFPTAEISPFGINETVAGEYYPVTPAWAEKNGFHWTNYPQTKINLTKTINASQIPDNTEETPDDILNWAINCEITKKPFKIIKTELKFYREHNLPIPRRHPDQRHSDRMELLHPRHLWTRPCMKCGREMQTTYAPERKEIVYCEECYLKEVY